MREMPTAPVAIKSPSRGSFLLVRIRKKNEAKGTSSAIIEKSISVSMVFLNQKINL
jgi:hypothetical protein